MRKDPKPPHEEDEDFYDYDDDHDYDDGYDDDDQDRQTCLN